MGYAEIYWIITGLFYAVDRGFALSCYSCTTLTSAACNITQTIEPCTQMYPVCLTMTYTSKWNNEERNYFQKKCVKDDISCQQNCNKINRAYDCKAHCCDSQLCNKEVDSQILWYGLMSSEEIKTTPFFVMIIITVSYLMLTFI